MVLKFTQVLILTTPILNLKKRTFLLTWLLTLFWKNFHWTIKSKLRFRFIFRSEPVENAKWQPCRVQLKSCRRAKKQCAHGARTSSATVGNLRKTAADTGDDHLFWTTKIF
eukprot:Pompholyxophrys_punicea_v1_NODE_595_length_1623_cov_2.719388.p4 type:complete len:111 gc:universal NODE_595_length_1623_cov_2.719388:1173-841(-)